MLLKRVKSGGSHTKVLALGIGNGIEMSELKDIASAPDKNVIVIQDFDDLTKVEKQLIDGSCTRKHLFTCE